MSSGNSLAAVDVDKSLLKYDVPFWSPPDGATSGCADCSMEVVKSGATVERMTLMDRGFYLIGRQPDICQISLEHPSVSRQHAVLQHRSPGLLYLFDLGSTHGSFVNKQRIQPGLYTPVQDGDFLQFGASTRMFFVALKPLPGPTAGSVPPGPSPGEVANGPPEPPPSIDDTKTRARNVVPVEMVAVGSNDQIDTGGNDDEKPDGPLFEGNPEELKDYLKRHQGKAHKKTAALIKKSSGFDRSDLTQRQTLGGGDASAREKKLDIGFNEKGTFGKRRPLEDHSDEDDAEESDAVGSNGLSGVAELDGEQEGDAMAQRRFIGLEHQADEGFDSDDDFFDRTASSRRTKKQPSYLAGKSNRSGSTGAITLKDLKIRLAGLTALLEEVVDETNWFLRTVYQGGSDRVAVEQAMADDEFDAYMAGMLGNVKQDKKEEFMKLSSDIKKQICATKSMIRIVTPALPELVKSVGSDDDRGIYDESAWAQDEMVREFALRLQQACTGINRDRTKRRKRARPTMSGSADPKRRKTAVPLTREQIDAEEHRQLPSTNSSEQTSAEPPSHKQTETMPLPETVPASSVEPPPPLLPMSPEGPDLPTPPPANVGKQPQIQQKKKKKKKAPKQVPQYDELDSFFPTTGLQETSLN